MQYIWGLPAGKLKPEVRRESMEERQVAGGVKGFSPSSLES